MTILSHIDSIQVFKNATSATASKRFSSMTILSHIVSIQIFKNATSAPASNSMIINLT